MNVSANMLGLDNAATPLGLKAMRELQEINPQKDTASNPMIMFLVLNTAGITLIPTSVIAIRASHRAQAGAGRLQRRRHLPADAARHLHLLLRRPRRRRPLAAHQPVLPAGARLLRRLLRPDGGALRLAQRPAARTDGADDRPARQRH
jgi:hypothetical protein